MNRVRSGGRDAANEPQHAAPLELENVDTGHCYRHGAPPELFNTVHGPSGATAQEASEASGTRLEVVATSQTVAAAVDLLFKE